jgi:uncharacterized protein YndB with AHSA1/START domain
VTNAPTEAAVEVAVTIAASPDTIFDFFTDPDKMIQWMGRDADLDPRPGGVMRCDINGRDVASGEFVELDPPHRLVFTWGWESEESQTRPGSSTVEVTLAEQGDETLVTLRHRDLPTPQSREAHTHGWNHYLDRLLTAAAGGNPGADPWASPQAADEEFEDGKAAH